MGLNNAELGNTIGRLRKSRGLTQRQVAKSSGLTVNYLSLIENGQRGVSLQALNNLATALKVPSEVIVFLAGDGKAKKDDPFGGLMKAARNSFMAAVEAETALDAD